MVPYGGLRGHKSLQTASEVKSDLRIKISDLNYICFNVYLCCNCLNFKNDTEEETFTSHRLRSRYRAARKKTRTPFIKQREAAFLSVRKSDLSSLVLTNSQLE